MGLSREPLVGPLLAEQIAYYSALAPEYERNAIPGWSGDDLVAALRSFRPVGSVLELACGTGTWTAQLIRYADSVTALDAAPEMLAIARARLRGKPVRFIESDLFTWRPDAGYDVVAFGFWLSHVPLERFDLFWELVADCLNPNGRVFFVDDAHRGMDELIDGESGSLVRRRAGARTHRIVKVPHTPAGLERRLAQLGWRITVTPAEGPFFYGEGARA